MCPAEVLVATKKGSKTASKTSKKGGRFWRGPIAMVNDSGSGGVQKGSKSGLKKGQKEVQKEVISEAPFGGRDHFLASP